MWKQPEYSELDIPSDLKELIYDSIYFNSEGNLSGSSRNYQLQIIAFFCISWGIVSFIVTYFLFVFLPISSSLLAIQVFVLLMFFIAGSYVFYRWGWSSYQESWYHFDNVDELLTVVRRRKGSWETIEVPYEEIYAIEWQGGGNGRAMIRTAGFSFPTNRASENRRSSVTELWSQLARIDTKMSNWPILLQCPQCGRDFGHHIGTAQCPWDAVILIDPEIKGRIDPLRQHPDDLDRV